MKIWKLTPIHSKPDDPIWQILHHHHQARIKALSAVIVRAQSEERARELADEEFLEDSLAASSNNDETDIIELSESTFLSKDYMACNKVAEDISIDEQILAIKYLPNSGFEDEIF